MGWIVRPRVLQLIYADNYGDPYNAVVTVTFTEPTKVHLSGLLSTHKFKAKEYKDLYNTLEGMGVKQVTWERIKDGKTTSRTLTIGD